MIIEGFVWVDEWVWKLKNVGCEVDFFGVCGVWDGVVSLVNGVVYLCVLRFDEYYWRGRFRGV